MYLVNEEGRPHFLNFLRNLGAQSILLTAFSIIFVSLESTTDISKGYVLSTVLFFTFIALVVATYSNIAEFGSHAFNEDRRRGTIKARYFAESMLALFAMMGSYFAVVIAVGTTVSNINIR